MKKLIQVFRYCHDNYDVREDGIKLDEIKKDQTLLAVYLKGLKAGVNLAVSDIVDIISEGVPDEKEV